MQTNSVLLPDDLPETDFEIEPHHRGTLTGDTSLIPVYPHSDPLHRDRLRTTGLLTGRIKGWTRMRPDQLWREWRRRLHGHDDLALDTLLDVGDRLARDRSPKQQEEWRRPKRALLGDAFSETEYVDPVSLEEHARLPLPFKGVLKALKHVARKRAGFRPWER